MPRKRFENSYIPEPNSGCWLWLLSLTWDGYGQFNRGYGRKARAHRLAYELYRGAIPPGALVLHKCDTERRMGRGKGARRPPLVRCRQLAFCWLPAIHPRRSRIVRLGTNTPSCVNPDHLYLGSNQDNMRDKANRGRGFIPSFPGELHPNAKLSKTDVLAIRKDTRDARIIAKDYQIQRDYVYAIRNRRVWKCLAG